MAQSPRSRSATAPKSRPTPSRPSTRKPTKRTHRSWWALGLAGVAIVVAVIVASISTDNGGHGTTAATSFDLPRLGAEGRVTLAATVGKPTVVNMFASWCDQCDAELPDFHKAAEALQGQVNFVFVNSNETGNWEPMAKRHRLLDFTVAQDVGGTLKNGLYRSLGGTGGMPMTAFYDDQGQLIDVARGALVGTSLKRALQQVYGVTY